MEYHFLCNDCKMVEVVSRPMEKSGDPAWCSICGEPLQRMFFPPKLMNRQKPGSFAQKQKSDWNAWDSKVAALKLAEENGEPKSKLKEIFGKTYDMALSYKKEKYA
jgi:hypothetical protein